MMNEKHLNQRNSSIDLLRILSMMGIIGIHVLNNGGGANYSNANDLFSYSAYAINLLRSLFYISVNVFAILSGYVYSGRKSVKYRRIIGLWGTVLFYSILITILTIVFKRELISDCFT